MRENKIIEFMFQKGAFDCHKNDDNELYIARSCINDGYGTEYSRVVDPESSLLYCLSQGVPLRFMVKYIKFIGEYCVWERVINNDSDIYFKVENIADGLRANMSYMENKGTFKFPLSFTKYEQTDKLHLTNKYGILPHRIVQFYESGLWKVLDNIEELKAKSG